MSTQVTTGEVRLSYVNVWQPKVADNGKEKYSVKVLVPKTDTATIEALKKAENAALEAGKQTKFGGKLVGVKRILRDGDAELESGQTDDETVRGCIFFNATSDKQPDVRMRNLQPCIDKAQLYSGVYAHVNVNFYPYKVDTGGGSKGVAAGLNAIMVKRDGEPLGSAFTEADAVAAFKDFADDDI